MLKDNQNLHCLNTETTIESSFENSQQEQHKQNQATLDSDLLKQDSKEQRIKATFSLLDHFVKAYNNGETFIKRGLTLFGLGSIIAGASFGAGQRLSTEEIKLPNQSADSTNVTLPSNTQPTHHAPSIIYVTPHPEGKVRQNWTTFSSPGFGIANFSFLAGKTSYLLITKLGLLTIKMLVLPRLSNFVQFHWTPSQQVFIPTPTSTPSTATTNSESTPVVNSPTPSSQPVTKNSAENQTVATSSSESTPVVSSPTPSPQPVPKNSAENQTVASSSSASSKPIVETLSEVQQVVEPIKEISNSVAQIKQGLGPLLGED
jgi:hypothetical protein